ncbi:hypothetical protein [Sinobaca sp. H24]|uniref:hypothetical protein n=1 Tax=Sinobaca sp. H24 TaxID=2923376 RepID=UPI00207A461C|nr:hypothetical protein [Sinobaca sp. H24]
MKENWEGVLVKLVYIQNGKDELPFVFFFDTVPKLKQELEVSTFEGFQVGDPLDLGKHQLVVFDTMIDYMENEYDEPTSEIESVTYYVKARK